MAGKRGSGRSKGPSDSGKARAAATKKKAKAASPKAAAGASSIAMVRDPAVRKPGRHVPGTPAFKTPKRVPKRFGELKPMSVRKMLTDLVPEPVPAPPEPVSRSLRALQPRVKRFHGVRVPVYWFPDRLLRAPNADMFGYMFPAAVRSRSKLPFNETHRDLLTELGHLMGDPDRDTGADSIIPAGYTYFGQFVDHDITFDVTSTIDAPQNANRIPNMRSPALDLDAVYGQGPALDPYLYRFPTDPTVPSTAVKLQTGRNRDVGPGGPMTAGGVTAVPTDYDVPRVLNGTDATVTPAASTFTAIIGDPRNDENLLVSQFHHAMLKFHNRVVDLLVLAGFAGDIFTEARKIVRQHYQWCVVHDFLPRICGAGAVNAAIATVAAPVGSAFRMPVEFSVAAYRFGHSMIRNGYVLNTSLPAAASTLEGVFNFIRVPQLPVFSNWSVDFNMFFNTTRPVPGHFNNARTIDSIMASGLESIPGGSGVMAVLAARNLLRGLAFGLPSGQAVARYFRIAPMSPAQLMTGLPPAEVTLLNAHGRALLRKTPLWYYVLREAMVLNGGQCLGPVGARIVAETFVRMLRRDADSFMNVTGYTPSLPSSTPGTFTIADLLDFAGVLTQ
jgi:hypothetical protein